MKRIFRFFAYYFRLVSGTADDVSTWTTRVQTGVGIALVLWPVSATWFGFLSMTFLPEPWRFWTPWTALACFWTGIFLLRNFDHVDRIERSVEPRVEIVGGSQEPFVMDWSNGRERFLLHRVKVRNPSLRGALTGAQVEIVEVESLLTGVLPLRLHLKDDNNLPFKTSFDLSPGAEQFVDVIQDQPAHTNPRVEPDRKITIQSVPQATFLAEPAPRYRLRLRVTARECPPIEAMFEVWRAEGRLEFRRATDN